MISVSLLRTETITISIVQHKYLFGKMATPMPTKTLILSAALKKLLSYFAKEREMLMQLFFRNLLQFQSSKLLYLVRCEAFTILFTLYCLNKFCAFENSHSELGKSWDFKLALYPAKFIQIFDSNIYGERWRESNIEFSRGILEIRKVF